MQWPGFFIKGATIDFTDIFDLVGFLPFWWFLCIDCMGVSFDLIGVRAACQATHIVAACLLVFCKRWHYQR